MAPTNAGMKYKTETGEDISKRIYSPFPLAPFPLVYPITAKDIAQSIKDVEIKGSPARPGVPEIMGL